MDQILFDRQGSPMAYSDDKQNIYFYSGRAAGYIEDGAIYAFSGKYLGSFDKGWVRDNDGHCVFFTQSAVVVGGPPKPVMRARPAKNDKKPSPARGLKKERPYAPAPRRTWSQLSGPHFFEI